MVSNLIKSLEKEQKTTSQATERYNKNLIKEKLFF